MRHRKSNVGLNRTASHRRALLANLASALFEHKKIMTTLSKARAARPYAERLITFARRGDLSARRHVLKKITSKDVVKVLFDEIGPRFKDRDGGYTRIIRLDNRIGDNAPMAVLELVGFASDEPAKKKRSGAKKTAGKVPAEAKPEKADEAEAVEEVVEEKVEKETPEKKEAAKPEKVAEKKTETKAEKEETAAPEKKPIKKTGAGKSKEKKPEKKTEAKKMEKKAVTGKAKEAAKAKKPAAEKTWAKASPEKATKPGTQPKTKSKKYAKGAKTDGGKR